MSRFMKAVNRLEHLMETRTGVVLGWMWGIIMICQIITTIVYIVNN